MESTTNHSARVEEQHVSPLSASKAATPKGEDFITPKAAEVLGYFRPPQLVYRMRETRRA